MGRSKRFQLDRTRVHGDGSVRYGVLSMVDVLSLKGADMKIVIGILIITIILWWPRKKGE